MNKVCVSIVSHGHGVMVARLIGQLRRFPEVHQILVTLNIPEDWTLPLDERTELIQNTSPAGFGENHNRAYRRCTQPFFCVLNPDVELPENPFPGLIETLGQRHADIIAPIVKNPEGKIEDSIRHFPSLTSLLRKAIGTSDGRYHIEAGSPVIAPDWVAGMFMLFRSDAFAQLGGFDTDFFLYYEDVDICLRARKAGMEILAAPSISIIHDARRDSRRRLRYLCWHLVSMFRYLTRHRGSNPERVSAGRKSS